MELIKEQTKFLEVLFSGSDRVMVESDVIVPDFKPDVLKVLQVDAVAGIGDKSISDGLIYVKGKVYVNILYIPDGESELPVSIKTSIDFKNKIDNPKITQDMKLKVICDVTKIDFEVLNSRKLALKATVSTSYEVVGEKEIEYCVGFDNTNCEYIKNEYALDTIGAFDDFDFVLRDSMEIASGKSSIKEILKTDYKICDREIKIVNQKLIIKGNVCVLSLYRTSDDDIDFCEGEFPFTEVFDVYSIDEDDKCLVDLNISDINLKAVEDNDKDFRIIDIECMISASVCAQRKQNITLISDCYLPGKKCDIKCGEMEINEFLDAKESHATIKEIIRPDTKHIELVRVYNVIAEAKVTKITQKDSKIDIEGNLCAYILYITDNKKCAVYSFKKDIEFTNTIDCPNAKKGAGCFVTAECERLSYNLNANGEIELRCIVNLNVKVTKNERVKVIEDIIEGDLQDNEGIILYFVKPGDTLWNISKNYLVKVSDIMNANHLEDDLIYPGQKLIIPNNL